MIMWIAFTYKHARARQIYISGAHKFTHRYVQGDEFYCLFRFVFVLAFIVGIVHLTGRNVAKTVTGDRHPTTEFKTTNEWKKNTMECDWVCSRILRLIWWEEKQKSIETNINARERWPDYIFFSFCSPSLTLLRLLFLLVAVDFMV